MVKDDDGEETQPVAKTEDDEIRELKEALKGRMDTGNLEDVGGVDIDVLDHPMVGSALTLLVLTLWLGVLLRECGEKKPRDCEEQGDVGCLVSIICISQFVPALGGEIMLAMLQNFSALVVIISYWTVSAIFLQFIKRCALVASHAGIAEAYCFPTQFAFDAFATLIFLQISFPKKQFFLVLAWTFVQVVFRDGDFKGIIQERVVGCLKKKAQAEVADGRIQELKEHSGAFPSLAVGT